MAKKQTPAVTLAPVSKKTREEQALSCLANIENHAAYEIKAAKETMDKFSARLAINPSDAFSWSASAFTAAAKLQASSMIAEIVELGKKQTADEYSSLPSPEKIIRETRRIIYNEVLRGAKWPEHSTSVSSNLIATEIVSAKAEWLERLDRSIERIED